MFSLNTEGKALLGKTFSAAAGGSGEGTQTSSGKIADPGDPGRQNWDRSCTELWWFPHTPHLTAKGLGPCPRYIRTPECRGNVSPTPGDSSVPLSQGSFIPFLPNYGQKVRTCTNLLINIQHSAAYPGLSETYEVPLLLIFHIRSPN